MEAIGYGTDIFTLDEIPFNFTNEDNYHYRNTTDTGSAERQRRNSEVRGDIRNELTDSARFSKKISRPFQHAEFPVLVAQIFGYAAASQ